MIVGGNIMTRAGPCRWRLGPARFGSYRTNGGVGCFRIYRPDAPSLRSCDSSHRLLFE
jgi:hypothetical protein